jgi:hypothetical protein
MTDVSATTGNRVVCYCADCQAFAHFLGRTDVLDAVGGTSIFQVAPSQVRILEGSEQIRCVRLSDRGLYRWYTDCCRTPIGNMIGPRFPFIGVEAIVDADGPSRQALLGAPRGYVFGKYAIGGCPPHAHPKVSLAMVPRVARLLLGWWVGRKAHPSAFFEARTGEPVRAPRVLTRAERAAVTPAAG